MATKRIIADDDEPEVISAQQTMKQQAGSDISKMFQKEKPQVSEMDRQQITFAFKEAERTISDLMEINKQLKNDIVSIKKVHEQERQERKDEIEQLGK